MEAFKKIQFLKTEFEKIGEVVCHCCRRLYTSKTWHTTLMTRKDEMGTLCNEGKWHCTRCTNRKCKKQRMNDQSTSMYQNVKTKDVILMSEKEKMKLLEDMEWDLKELGPSKCFICRIMYTMYPRYIEAYKEKSAREIEHLAGVYCSDCESWYCSACAKLVKIKAYKCLCKRIESKRQSVYNPDEPIEYLNIPIRQ